MNIIVEQVAGKRLEIRTSDAVIVVDELTADGGPGDGARPTELLLGGLGACMAGTMLTFARDQQIPIRAVTVHLTDTVESVPKRISSVDVVMKVEGDITERQAASLERAAANCKIGNTLAGAPTVELSFEVSS